MLIGTAGHDAPISPVPFRCARIGLIASPARAYWLRTPRARPWR